MLLSSGDIFANSLPLLSLSCYSSPGGRTKQKQPKQSSQQKPMGFVSPEGGPLTGCHPTA